MVATAPAITAAFQLVGRGEGKVKGTVFSFKTLAQYHFYLYLIGQKVVTWSHSQKESWEGKTFAYLKLGDSFTKRRKDVGRSLPAAVLGLHVCDIGWVLHTPRPAKEGCGCPGSLMRWLYWVKSSGIEVTILNMSLDIILGIPMHFGPLLFF